MHLKYFPPLTYQIWMDNSSLLLISKHGNTVTISPLGICYGHQSYGAKCIAKFKNLKLLSNYDSDVNRFQEVL